MIRLELQWNDSVVLRRVERVKQRFDEVPKKGVQEVAPVIKARAVELSPKKSGSFARSWKYRTQGASEAKGTQSTLSLENTDPKARAVLYGSRAHFIYPRSAKKLKFNIGGETIFASRVFFPGTRGINVFEMLNSDSLIQERVQSTFSRMVSEAANAL